LAPAWHFEHVLTMLRRLSVEAVSVGGRMLWVPWQSEHFAAPASPRRDTFPWNVSKKVSASVS
jgi:hypothetical protein